MAPNPKIHVGDTGSAVEITFVKGVTPVDISSATQRQMLFLKPSGTVLIRNAVFSTDGRDGRIRYISTANDFDEEGFWKVQGYVASSGGSWHSDIYEFEVEGNLRP